MYFINNYSILFYQIIDSITFFVIMWYRAVAETKFRGGGLNFEPSTTLGIFI